MFFHSQQNFKIVQEDSCLMLKILNRNSSADAERHVKPEDDMFALKYDFKLALGKE